MMNDIDLEKAFGKHGREIVDYLKQYGGAPGSLLRIFQRLRLKPPSNPAEAHVTLLSYLDSHGSGQFKARMGMLRESDQLETPRDPSATSSALVPATTTGPNGNGDSQLFGPRRRSSSTIFRALPSTTTPPPLRQWNPKEEPQPTPPPDPQWPAILRDVPRECVTPEALAAARQGENPFGEPPLIERRSGMDRRSGRDRREELQLVFRNSRYGGSRRKAGERRKSPPPPRPASATVDEAIGSPSLRKAGWKPAPPPVETEGPEMPHVETPPGAVSETQIRARIAEMEKKLAIASETQIRAKLAEADKKGALASDTQIRAKTSFPH
jgi:hypothetical protein